MTRREWMDDGWKDGAEGWMRVAEARLRSANVVAYIHNAAYVGSFCEDAPVTSHNVTILVLRTVRRLAA